MRLKVFISVIVTAAALSNIIWFPLFTKTRYGCSSDSGSGSGNVGLRPNNDLIIQQWNASGSDNNGPPPTPTLYYCHPNNNNGMREIKKLMSDVLPEYVPHDLHLKDRPYRLSPEYMQGNYTNRYDVFIGHFNEFCLPSVERWLHTHFRGQIVLFSGESVEYHPNPVKNIYTIDSDGNDNGNGNEDNSNIHAFGPVKYEREGDMTLFYLQLTWWFYFYDQLTPDEMVDANKRPRGNQTKTNFMIYANSNCVPFREEAVGRLSEIGIVHCDGKCQGETPPSGDRTNLVQISSDIRMEGWLGNVQIYSKYRFCFVMEHHPSHPSYITEKILMAYIGGCIPIYYGTEKIFDIFNRKSFVFYNISDPQPALDLVAAMENDTALYEEMMSEPIAANGNKTIEDYFSFSDEIGGGLKKKEMRKKLGLSDLQTIE